METVFVFGNTEVEMDALPIRIIPELARLRPDLHFVVKDPNEDWDIPRSLWIIDTVVGVTTPMLFRGLDAFGAAPHVSVHDFDAYANLRLLQKLGKLDAVTIIGLPVGVSEADAIKAVTRALPPPATT